LKLEQLGYIYASNHIGSVGILHGIYAEDIEEKECNNAPTMNLHPTASSSQTRHPSARRSSTVPVSSSAKLKRRVSDRYDVRRD
jgi:hypothetical protein